MKILVCVKQVPASSVPRQYADTGTAPQYILNKYDEYALEEACLIKKKISGSSADAVTAGPLCSGQAVKRALQCGADSAFHIITEDSWLDSRTAAALIAAFAKGRGYSLIITGVMSQDLMNSTTGPFIAAELGIPCAVSVLKADIDVSKQTAVVESEIEGGFREKILLRLPALLAVQTGINTPSYPTLTNRLRSASAEISVIKADHLLPQTAKLQPPEEKIPEKKSSAIIISGTPGKKAGQLIDVLKKAGLA